MANETTAQTTCLQENHEADEYWENIPPGVTAAAGTSKLNVQGEGEGGGGDMTGYTTTQSSGENEPLSGACICSTPAPTSGKVKSKSRLSGLQSALTPILKFMNIGNKCPSPEPLKHGNHPHITVPSSSSGNDPATNLKETGSSTQHSNSDLPSNRSGRTSSDPDAPVCWLADESLPEITLLDNTCDTTMQLSRNDSALLSSLPSTPLRVNTGITPRFPKRHASTNLSSQILYPEKNKLDVLQSGVGIPKTGKDSHDQVTLVSKDATETSVVMDHRSGGSCDVASQRSSGHVAQEAGTTDLCPRRDSFKQSSTTTVPEGTSVDKPCPPADCTDKGIHSQIDLHGIPICNDRTSDKDLKDKMIDIPENIDAPLRWLDDRYFTEITLLDVTRDSELPGGEMSSMDVTQDSPSVDTLQKNVTSSTLGGEVSSEPGISDTIQNEVLSNALDGNVVHTSSSVGKHSSKCVSENTPKTSFDATRDISMGSVFEDSQPSSESSGQNTTKIQTSPEDTLDIQPVNITHDVNSSRDTSVQSSEAKFSTSEAHCNASSKSVPSVVQSEPVATSHILESNGMEPQLSPNAALCLNTTFTIEEHSNLSNSSNGNTTSQISCPQNETLDVPASAVTNPQAGTEAKDRPASVSKKTIENSPVVNQSRSAVNSSGSVDGQNATFDRYSLQKSADYAVSGEAGSTPLSLRNQTFDAQSPKQNGTFTVSETSSSENRRKTVDKAYPHNIFSATSSPIDSISEKQPAGPSKLNGSGAGPDADAKMSDTPATTFDTNPAAGVAAEAVQGETKDRSRSVLMDDLSDTFGHQSMDMEEIKSKTLNLDDTIDLKADALITSTPMPYCFHVERIEGKNMGAQKKLYGDGPGSPPGRAPPDVPPNIVCDRKTFLTQPAAKSVLPRLKAAAQFPKPKAAPARTDLTSGPPMTRQRTQGETLRNAAAADAPHMSTGLSAAYNFRPTTLGSKQLNTGLRKPQTCGVPPGIHRAAPGLNPPLARRNGLLSSSTDKLSEPTGLRKNHRTDLHEILSRVSYPMTKTNQAKKHHLSRGDSLPISKRKKMDAPVPSGGSEALSSSRDPAAEAKNLKQPTTSQRALPPKPQRTGVSVPTSTAETSTSCKAASRPRLLKQPVTNHRALLPKAHGHACAKCVMLEQQLETQSEEIRRLKEELLKNNKPEEEC